MDVDAWLAAALADAEARGLPDLKPLLETLARSTRALRAADVDFGHPARVRDDETAEAATGEEPA
jgi:hypothetical protein